MADRPIIFSAPMVRALIEGRKTQTRRVLKPQPDMTKISRPAHPEPRGGRSWVFMARDDFPGYSFATADFQAPYAIGDRLWVREALVIESSWEHGPYDPPHSDGRPLRQETDGDGVDYWLQPHYRATDPAPDLTCGRHDGPCCHWKPSIHMPRWASRLTLTVTDVRVQRLQEISEEDARAEGLEWAAPTWGVKGLAESWNGDPRLAFAALWNSIHGPDAWSANPWCCALTFTVERRNIDAKEG